MGSGATVEAASIILLLRGVASLPGGYLCVTAPGTRAGKFPRQATWFLSRFAPCPGASGAGRKINGSRAACKPGGSSGRLETRYEQVFCCVFGLFSIGQAETPLSGG